MLTPASQPTLTPEEQLELLREENRPIIEDDRPDIRLEERQRTDLLRTSIERDFLRLELLVDEAMMLSEVPISDWPGVCSVFVRQSGLQATLIHQTVDAPGRVLEITQVAKLPARLTIARDYETLEVQGNVFFVQSENPDFPSDGPVTLRVNISPIDGVNTDVVVEEHYLIANNFSELRKQAPEVFETHLLPILLDLAPDFGPYPGGAALQVLLGDIDVDPKVRAQVLALMPALDAESFRERRKARAALLSFGADAAAVGLTLDDLTPEQSAAMDDLIRSFRVIAEEDARVLRDDPAFLVFALSDSNAGVRRAAAKRLVERYPGLVVPNIDRPLSYQFRSELLEQLELSD